MTAGTESALAPSWLDRVARDPVELTIRLTLVAILLFPGDLWFHRIYVRIFAAWALALPGLAVSRWFWLMMSVQNLLVQNLYNWAVSDNHMWLFSYWFLAIGLSLGTAHPAVGLALNGRLLLGLAFLFATLKKLFAPEFMSGAALRFLLQTDPRFYEVAKLCGGHTQHAADIWQAMNRIENVVTLDGGVGLRACALAMTWWTLVIEAPIGVLFLVDSGRTWLIGLRSWLLLVFVSTTYFIAPVVGFGWLLVIMGLAQCPLSMRKTRFAFMAAIAVVFLFYGEHVKVELMKWMYGIEFFRI